MKIISPSGTNIPLSAGAVGKIFLAYMDEEKALRYLTTKGLRRYTDNTIIDLESYLREIKRVRELGFAIDREEYLQEVRAVAVHVETEDPPLAAIWVVGFSSSLTDKKIEYVIQQTLQAAHAISLELRRRAGT